MRKKTKERKIGTFDIETDPFARGRKVLIPFCCDFYDGESHVTFWGVDCLEKLTDAMLRFDGIIYAHNGGKFDFHFLLKHLPDDTKIFCIRNRIAKLTCGKTEFRDSFLIIPTGLSKFGNKLEIEYSKLESDVRDNHKVEILEYLRQDTLALYRAVSNFRDRFGDKLTIASTAFHVLKTEFGINPPSHNNPIYDAEFRKYYYGGRVQVFQPGKSEGELIYIDINSAYPAAMMKKHFFGLGYIRHEKLSIKKSDLQTSFIRFIGFSDGALPVRKKDGGLHFPKIDGEFFATGWEFVSGKERGKIKVEKIIEILTPYETLTFAPFVEKFYSQKLLCKQTGDKEGELFAKLLLNSGYGKFAINPENFCDHCFSEIGENPKEEGEWEFVRDFDDADLSLWEKPSEKEPRYNNVATAASITGAVRAYLSESLDRVIDPIYCDTDSIICRGTGILPIGENLGQWGIEAEGREVFIGGKKIYAFLEKSGNWKKASKGAVLSVDEIKKIALGGEVEWESISPNFSTKRSSVTFVKRRIKQTS